LNAVLHLSELSDQLDVTLESSKIVKLALTGSRRPKALPSNKDHAIYSDFLDESSRPKDAAMQFMYMSLYLVALY
jgi:hypothetical protein